MQDEAGENRRQGRPPLSGLPQMQLNGQTDFNNQRR